MRIAYIGCMVLNREVSAVIANSENKIRTWWLKQGLHDTPELLRERLQGLIDDVETENATLSMDKKFDAICLGYGLCSNGVVGLEAKTLPMVIPKCDDCISLFLGSADRYMDLFNKKTGIYWYTPGWIEEGFTPSEQSYQARYKEYLEKYGEENADYLMEAENNWVDKYQHCIYIDSPVYKNKQHIDYAKKAADYMKCEFSIEYGEQSLIAELLTGSWSEENFLVCPPGHRVIRRYDRHKIDSEIIS